MKVAVVTHYFPSSVMPWQGHSAYQTLRRLSRMCDVQIFCSLPEYPALLKPNTALPPFDPAWRPGEVDVTYVPYVALPVVSRPLNGYTIARRVLPHVRAFRPDIILNYVIYPQGFAAVRIARALRVPSVLTAIGSDLNRISDKLSGVMTRSALRGADFVTTVSHDLAKTAISMGSRPETTRAILNGCETSVFYPRSRDEARRELRLDLEEETILYVGRLDLRKGLLELVESMAALRSRRPGAHCYLVGDGPDRPALEAAVAKHQLAGNVSFVPPCSGAAVATWMAASNLVTLPSYNEGCPNVVIEALSCGRPVVATRVGGIPELMDERCGRLIPRQDVPALTQALDEALGLPWNAEDIHRTHSRSWTDVAEDLFAVLGQVAGRAGKPTS